MSVKKEPSGRRSIQVEVELPGTPEEIWRTIASGPGVTCWFVPTETDERVGGTVTSHFGPGIDGQGTITIWEPPHRFAAESGDLGPLGPNAPAIATEWTVEARSGGTCVVRVVHSLFAGTDDWDNQLTDLESGWPTFFRILLLYTKHFKGEPCSSIQALAMTSQSADAAWHKLLEVTSLAGAKVGERRSIQVSGLPQLTGVVEHATDAKHTLILRVEEPAPALALLMAENCHGTVMTALTVYCYGTRGAEMAKRDAALWQKWFSELLPAPSDATHVA